MEPQLGRRAKDLIHQLRLLLVCCAPEGTCYCIPVMEDSCQIEKQKQTNEVPALLGYDLEDVDRTDKLAMHFIIVSELRKITVCCER